MACENCGETIRVRKGLIGKASGKPDDCPECGHELTDDDEEKALIEK